MGVWENQKYSRRELVNCSQHSEWIYINTSAIQVLITVLLYRPFLFGALYPTHPLSISLIPESCAPNSPWDLRIDYINPPTDRPFETITNFHFQKCPLVLYTHGDTIWTVLVASCTTIQIHSNGLRGSIDSPLRSIQTRFCISCTTI